MTTILKKFYLIAALATMMLASCSEGTSYTERLNSERFATNAFLANNRVVNEIPADTVFETGDDAPYYRIDPDGNVYMKVIKAGDRVNDKAVQSQSVYFRYTRYNLENWYSSGVLEAHESNETDMTKDPGSFRYMDFSMDNSSSWGYGIQLPLQYLGVECEVWLIVKSQYGITSELSYVLPFLYHIRYFHSRI
ncbi:MAG: DUF4827 family protein [Bacteroidales bacterium]|nr:DUF4827 family protein [Candidatus Sodaliphilus aphodohippi]